MDGLELLSDDLLKHNLVRQVVDRSDLREHGAVSLNLKIHFNKKLEDIYLDMIFLHFWNSYFDVFVVGSYRSDLISKQVFLVPENLLNRSHVLSEEHQILVARESSDHGVYSLCNLK